MPPSSCMLIAADWSMPMTKTSAPNFTTREAILETLASCRGVASGRIRSR